MANLLGLFLGLLIAILLDAFQKRHLTSTPPRRRTAIIPLSTYTALSPEDDDDVPEEEGRRGPRRRVGGGGGGGEEEEDGGGWRVIGDLESAGKDEGGVVLDDGVGGGELVGTRGVEEVEGWRDLRGGGRRVGDAGVGVGGEVASLMGRVEGADELGEGEKVGMRGGGGGEMSEMERAFFGEEVRGGERRFEVLVGGGTRRQRRR
ncbi:hypothetical protein HDU67_005020 [Dinochytrium kinnereticum]|nr:hypothetical protein HDU67_005020 [Dinochytrium kinnereticum]